ncbi:MAG: P63C domain-containing protein [Pirellulales bacterium]
MSDATEPNGRAKGGAARAAALSPERRREIAQQAALARHGLKATHKGNFKEEFGLDIECYVLNDKAKSAAISLRGLGTALGFSDGGGGRLTRFLSGARVAPYVGLELRQKLETPIIFQSLGVGPAKTYGYDVTLLTELCRLIVKASAEGALHPTRHAEVVKQANIILGASANAGITGLVYALAGFKPETEEVIQAFKAFVQEEARKYEQEFPNELYVAWQRLYKIPLPARGKPWQFMHLTRNHIYVPLARSNGKLLELLRALRSNGKEQSRYLFSFLNEIGARALRMQIGRVLEMAESSGGDPRVYEAKIVERFGGQQEFDFSASAPNTSHASE